MQKIKSTVLTHSKATIVNKNVYLKIVIHEF